MIIRKAKTGEGKLLSELAYRSKKYWGYDDEFMDAAREDLTITEDRILSDIVYVLEDLSLIVGFFCLIISDERKELDFLFIDPQFIGKGYGKVLWSSIIKEAEARGVHELTIISDPHAEEFYKKMGAIRIGDFNSTIFKNRKLPLMKAIINKSNI